MMRKILIISGIIAAGIIIVSCNRTKRNPGRTYMPDMAYSRAYETYSSTKDLEKKGIYFNAKPVEGTMAKGDLLPYPYKNDSLGYALSATVKNPLDSQSIDMTEAERLYLIYCGICHGQKLDGNGPLWNDGNGPFPSAPKNFMDPTMKTLAEGTMFHSATYGKNMMGSYASQLTAKQRWMVIAYIKSKQLDQQKPTVPVTDSTGK